MNMHLTNAQCHGQVDGKRCTYVIPSDEHLTFRRTATAGEYLCEWQCGVCTFNNEFNLVVRSW